MEFITYEAEGQIGIITINRPKALNALNSTVLEELDKTLDAVDLQTVRCLILTGAGEKSFVAGADIGEMSTLTKAEGEAFGKKGNDVFRKLETFPIPVIAAVNGFALGGGCEISMSCDIRICSENAVFGQPEVGLGITPGFGGTQRLARIVGTGKAKEMIYGARNIKAEEAYRIGLVNNVYPLEELMPAAISFAHKLTKKLSAERKNGHLPWLRPDGKSQVSVQYAADGSVERIDNVVISTQHSPDIDIRDLREAVVEEIIRPTLPENLLDRDTKFYVNPTGRFVIGGPVGDSGLTGRKIIVDTYGGYAAHGGGCFSGKDPTKVDRSAAYMARYVAKNIVAAGLARRCQIELAYAIGVAQPVSIHVDTYGTGKLSDLRLSGIVSECFDLRPAAIISALDLRRPIYQQTAAYGHFGRTDLDLPWEKTDAVEKILAKA